MRPSVVLDMNRSAVREMASRFRTANPRVFGSVLHGTDRIGTAATSTYWSMHCRARRCSTWAACRTSWNRCSAFALIC